MKIKLLAFLSISAFAQLRSIEKQEFPYESIVVNGGFEANTSDWTPTGSATIVHSTTTPARGLGKGIVDFTASGEFLRSTLVSSPTGYKNCLAKFKYNGGGTSDIYYRVTDGTNTLAGYTSASTQFKISSAVTTWTDSLDLTFPCPSSGSVRLELESAGNAAALSIDDVYIGENFRVGTVQQANLYGKIRYVATASCAWSANSASFTNFPADTDCATGVLTGQAVDPGSKIPALKFNNIPAGQLVVIATGAFQRVASASDYEAHFRMSDGTNNSSSSSVYMETTSAGINGQTIIGTFNYSTAQGATTIQMQAKNSAGSIQIPTSADDFEMTALFFPSQADTVVSANVPYQGGTLSYSPSGSCAWATTSTGGYASFPADTDCSSPSVTGIISAPATKKPSMVATSLEAGSYLVLVQSRYSTSTSGVECKATISDGSSVSGFSANYSSSGGVYGGLSLAGVFTYTSKQSNITWEVQGITNSGTCTIDNADTTASKFIMSLIPLSPSISMPQIVNSVRSYYNGITQTKRGLLNCDASPTFTSYDGTTWATIAQDSTGLCTLTFSPTWKDTNYICMFNGTNRSANDSASLKTTSQYQIAIRNSSGTLVDGDTQVICIGDSN